MTPSSALLRFLKDWTLLVCMALGALLYYVLRLTPALEPLCHPAAVISHALLPYLIFVMLFLTFVKVDVRSYRFVAWHAILIILQLILSAGVAFLTAHHGAATWRPVAEGVFCCLLCPTATAASVIVRKLGGRVPTIATYTLLSGFVSAVAIPLLLPVMENNPHLDFGSMFLVLLSRVSPPLIAPFVLAVAVRKWWPALTTYLSTHFRDAAFYLWGFNLVLLVGQTIHSVYRSQAPGFITWALVAAGLLVCLFQFWSGRRIGRAFDDRISCGQGFGQKNTVIAVWIALTYLSPVTAVAPGSYILWQNLINSWQLWKAQRRGAAN